MNRLYTYVDSRGSIGLLLLRLVVGGAFILHGLPKIQNPFGWAKGGAFPGFLQALAAVSEFGGGIALIVGLLTPLALFGLMCTMAVAVYVHVSQGQPWVGNGGSYELAALYLAIAVFLVLIGPGRFALDTLLFGKKSAGAPISFLRLARQPQE